MTRGPPRLAVTRYRTAVQSWGMSPSLTRRSAKHRRTLQSCSWLASSTTRGQPGSGQSYKSQNHCERDVDALGQCRPVLLVGGRRLGLAGRHAVLLLSVAAPQCATSTSTDRGNRPEAMLWPLISAARQALSVLRTEDA